MTRLGHLEYDLAARIYISRYSNRRKTTGTFPPSLELGQLVGNNNRVTQQVEDASEHAVIGVIFRQTVVDAYLPLYLFWHTLLLPWNLCSVALD